MTRLKPGLKWKWKVEVEQAMELKAAVAPKPQTGWSYLAGSGHKTEEHHLNVEKLTALIVCNASTSLIIWKYVSQIQYN